MGPWKTIAAAVALQAAAGLLIAPAAAAEPVRVTVSAGVLEGEQTERAAIFRNIPYAAAPVGERRWAPPAPAPAWTGVRPAVAAGPSCPQPMREDGQPNDGGANGPVSEDCLQLNVFAPLGTTPGAKAPVMVWLHGGGHRTGAGWVYDGQNFARDGVVLVAINYRLGPLGYFAHPALTRAAGARTAATNFGLMDQIAALRWVQANIAAFGGDPANVTVFGESAGGASTLALLAAPQAKGLFHKAIVQSGLGWFEPKTLADQEKAGVAVAEKLGLGPKATAAELRALPVERLIAEGGGEFGPIADGRLLPKTPTQAFAAGTAHDVPLIIGWNSGEDSLLGGPGGGARFAAAVPPIAAMLYPQEAAEGDEALGRAVFTDRVFGAPARWIARKASAGAPAYLYHFSYVGDRFRRVLTRAHHAAEIQYVFEYWGRRTPMSVVSDEDRAMASLMHGCWTAFAKTGTPTCEGQAWPAYDAASDTLLEFGSPTGLRQNFRKQPFDALEQVTLPTLALPER